MALEIERKFLLKNNSWRDQADPGHEIKQGYLNSTKARTVRVRLMDGQGFLTIKGQNIGTVRQEFEYPIPGADAMALLNLCEQPIVEKTRYHVRYQGLTWEVDVFSGVNAGLEMVEVELEAVDQEVIFPDWVGEEVSSDPRYYNSNLIAHPYGSW
ncbi:MAG: CYTH domain-containing protein [Bacteroidota bacterium]